MYICNICSEEFNDNILLLCHHELFHTLEERSQEEGRSSRNQEERRPSVIQRNQEERRPSVIQYAPAASLKVEVLAQAFQRSVVRHYKIQNTLNFNLQEFLQKGKPLIISTLKNEQKRLNFIKFGIILDAIFTNAANELSPRGFITKNQSMLATSDVEEIIESMYEELILKLSEHEGRGSGWSLLSVIGFDIRVHKHGYGDRGSSYIPLPKKISNTNACINVQNVDNKCFYYAMLTKFIGNVNNYKPDRRYEENQHRYNFRGVEYPTSLSDIKRFEKNNPGSSVHVFGLDSSNNVYPLQLSPIERIDHTDLLLIKSGNVSHYVYIQDFNKLVAKQVSKSDHRLTVCKRCFCFARGRKGGDNWIIEHQRLCRMKEEVRVSLPCPEKARIEFSKVSQQYRIPIVVYADFESSLLPLDIADADPTRRTKYQLHSPNSYCLLLKSTLPECHLQQYGLTSTPQVYRGEEASKKFLDDLYEIARKVEHLYKQVIPMSPLTQQQEVLHSVATHCYLCNNIFTNLNAKVHDHDHLTGCYRGPACNNCNINYKLPKFIPIVLHNLSGYDSHFIIPELGRDDGTIDVLATSFEKFISFSKKVGKIKLRFIDSLRFMPSSLMKLVENLRKQDLVETSRTVPADKLELVLRKGVFPYDYLDNATKFNETCLPPIECFYNKLNEKHIKPKDYQHACRVWEELEMKTLGEYSDFYVKLDVTLLCDVMEEFRNTCYEAYGLDPLHSYTSPGLAWQAMLKETRCVLDLFTDIDMLLMVESGIRGGLTQCVTRYVKANNKHVPDYNENQESIYLGYFDANNLYGWAMSNPLPYGDFMWVNPDTLEDVKSIPSHGDIGYILDCDFEYPEELHDHHYDLPFLARSEIPPSGKNSKLMMTLNHKERYVAHFWVVQQALQMGLRIRKIHRAIQFSQSCWLRPYIESNTTRRAAATSSFQKDFYKLMNNAIFGKTLENKRKHKNVKLVTTAAKLEDLVRKPNFKTSVIINENLVAVSMKPTKIVMDRPLYVGMCILDISKTHMYDFHYNKMLKYYGRDRIGISYMDTDAFMYWIKTKDMYEDLKTFPYTDDFDFSDYPIDHPTYDGGKHKKVLGKFKDETNSWPIEEFVGLMAKLYAFKKVTIENFTDLMTKMYACKKLKIDKKEKKDEIKKAKGVKNIYLKKKLQLEHYKTCLFNETEIIATFNNIRSFNHQLYSITEKKKALSAADDKRYILNNKINTLPFGHYSIDRIDD